MSTILTNFYVMYHCRAHASAYDKRTDIIRGIMPVRSSQSAPPLQGTPHAQTDIPIKDLLAYFPPRAVGSMALLRSSSISMALH